MSQQDLQAVVSQVRRDIVRMVHAVNSGHPGGSLGCVEFLTTLYFYHMKQVFTFSVHCERLRVVFHVVKIERS